MNPVPEEADIRDVKMAGLCRHCKASIVWVRRLPDGEAESKLHPVDPKPSTDGTIMIYWTHRYGPDAIFYERLGGSALREKRRYGWRLHNSHFDTCQDRPARPRRRRW